MDPSVTANGEVLNVMDKFTYHGSIRSRDVHMDNEVDRGVMFHEQNRIEAAPKKCKMCSFRESTLNVSMDYLCLTCGRTF